MHMYIEITLMIFFLRCEALPKFILLHIFSICFCFSGIETYSSSSTMWCLEWNRKLDKLGNISTWIVLKSNNNQNSHPSYCIGAVYLMTGRAVDAMIRRHDVQSSQTQLPEDVYVTGVLTKEAGITISHLGHRFEYEDIEQIDIQKVTFVNFRDTVKDSMKKMWAVFAKDKLNESRRSDTGL